MSILLSGRTVEKIRAVCDAARAEPEKFGDLPQVMDEKSVNAAHRKLRKLQDEKARALSDRFSAPDETPDKCL